MSHIAIISSSVREGRESQRVAWFFEKYIEANQLGTSEVLDLMQYQFPLFEERLKLQKDPLPKTLEFAEKIKMADAVVIVTPEYNGGYPASLKNIIDLMYEEWRKKPIAISTVSSGAFAGSQVITSLQFTLWKMQAWTVPVQFPVAKVSESFDEEGNPADKASAEKRAKIFFEELLWCVEAKKRMQV